MRLPALVLLFVPLSVWAVVSEDALPDQAQWISASAEATPDAAFFRRTFEIGPKLVKAVLLAAADQTAELYVNGARIAEVRGFTQAKTLDVTSFIRSGTNILGVRVANNSGPAAFRLMLELAFADGKQRWVISDTSWLASRRQSAGWMEANFSTSGWTPAFPHGSDGLQKWGNPFQAAKSPDAYNSWMLARNADRATDPATFTAMPDFRVELLRSAQPDEDSWVAIAFDPNGRVTVAREKRGLLRMTLGGSAVERVEVLNESLLECRGLLYAYDSLYVNANNSKGFYRLRDTDGDGSFDEQKLLLQTEGGVGHGRNHLTLGPDGFIYLAHGDDVVLPPNLATNSPLRQMMDDQLMPFPEAQRRHNPRRFAQVGHVLQTDRDGSFFKLIAGGLRNPLGLAFNEAGEMFTYDADMERDIGAPWYLPTRVLHLVPGGDYGWRRSRPNLMPFSPDVLPAAVDIGVGSPTAVSFGTSSRFPEKYRHALFIGDWAYGRILAVHLRPEGASYRGEAETFLSGRPLNVTDFTFGPDGAMYFATGGRGTKSGLYRVSYQAAREPQPLTSMSIDHQSARLRALRHKLEILPSDSEQLLSNTVEQIWSNLGHSDRWIRYAARLDLERQPVELWLNRALSEKDSRAGLTALLALARVTGQEMQDQLLSRLSVLLRAGLPEAEQIGLLRLVVLRFARFGLPANEIVATLIRQLEPLYPGSSRPANYELCRLLTFLGAPNVVTKTTTLIERTRSTADLLHYALFVAPMQQDWTIEQRRQFFEALRRIEQEQGGSDYYGAVKSVRMQTATHLPVEQANQLANVLAPSKAVPATIGSANVALPFVREWKLEDFDVVTAESRSTGEVGRQAYRDAGCVLCHRFGNEGSVFGPDLTSVGARFGRRDLLEAILNPSKAIDEKYRSTTLLMKNGEERTGLVEREDDEIVVLGTGLSGDTILEIEKSAVASRHVSDVSPMPTGLLNVLTRPQILDLLTYLERGEANPATSSVPQK